MTIQAAATSFKQYHAFINILQSCSRLCGQVARTLKIDFVTSSQASYSFKNFFQIFLRSHPSSSFSAKIFLNSLVIKNFVYRMEH